MPFVISTVCRSIDEAKQQAPVAQGLAYAHDAAWSVYSDSPAVQAWLKSYAAKVHYSVFLSTPERIPQNAPFVGPNGGLNAGLMLGFLFDQPVLCLHGPAEVKPEAIARLDEMLADAVAGACSGIVDDPLSWKKAVEQTLQSLHAGVVSPNFAAKQLTDALKGAVYSDTALPCSSALWITAGKIDKACIAPSGLDPLRTYVNTAGYFGLVPLEPRYAWVQHPTSTTWAGRFEATWRHKEQAEAYWRTLDYVFTRSHMRTVSDYMIDEALRQTSFAPQAAFDAATLKQIQDLGRAELADYVRLTIAPKLPDAKDVRRDVRSYFAAQNDWKEVLRSWGEKGMEDTLRL